MWLCSIILSSTTPVKEFAVVFLRRLPILTPQVKLASGGCRVRRLKQWKLFDRSASCWEIQKGGSPFGRFKGFPKGEYEIPLWRALSFRLHPVSFCTGRKKWGGFLRTALHIALPTTPHQSPPVTASPGGGSLGRRKTLAPSRTNKKTPSNQIDGVFCNSQRMRLFILIRY